MRAFALDHDGQRRRLHAADRGLVEAAFLGVEGRHGARAVDADQPVGFRAAARGIGQRLHFLVGAQVGEAVADRGGGHRLQPQAAHRLLLLAQGVLRDVAEDQLALAARVAGIDQAGDVLALDQAGQQLEALLGLSIGFSAKCGGIIGRWVKLHLPRLTSYSSGTASSSRWPMAEDST
jgi:hypothetical protein